MPEICFNNLSIGYGGTAIISGIDLTFFPGSITALIGPNGCGKSTLLKTASGLLEPVSGEVLIGGKSITGMPLRERARLISVMLTERVSTEYTCCFDIVSVGRYSYTGILGITGRDDRQAVLNAMEKVGVVELANRDFSRLSDGQKQRVLLARAIVSDPSVLILDEPTSFLDIGCKLEFLDILKELAREHNIAVLISMHEIELAGKIADKLVCISSDNHIDRIGHPCEVLTDEYIEKLFSIKPGKYKEYYSHET